MMGYYELKRAGNSEYMFNLKAGNHETVLTSETYSGKDAAKNGIASVQKNAPDEERYERKIAKDGSAYFVLAATNGKPIGKSEMYSNPSARDKGIEAVRTIGPTTTIKEAD